MTTYEKLFIAVTVVLALVLGVGAYYYVQNARDLAGADAVAKLKAEDARRADVAIDALQKQMDARDKLFADQQAQLERARDAITTQAQAVAAIRTHVTGAQVQSVTPDQLPESLRKLLGNAPGYTVMTDDTAIKFARMSVDVERLTGQVTALTADNADLKRQLTEEKTARKDAEDTANSYKHVAKRSWIRRVFSAGKWTTVGAAGAVTAVVVVEKVVLHK